MLQGKYPTTILREASLPVWVSTSTSCCGNCICLYLIYKAVSEEHAPVNTFGVCIHCVPYSGKFSMNLIFTSFASSDSSYTMAMRDFADIYSAPAAGPRVMGVYIIVLGDPSKKILIVILRVLDTLVWSTFLKIGNFNTW